MSDPHGGESFPPPATAPDASPAPFPPLDPLPGMAADAKTEPAPDAKIEPDPDYVRVLGEILTLVEVWRHAATEDRLPPDVRSVYRRCANSVEMILAHDHFQTDVSELAPESSP